MRCAVLASGRGSNLQALLDAQADGRLAPAQIALVLSDRARAGAIERARAAGLPAVVVARRDYPDRRSFDRQLLDTVRAHDVQAVVLAGFMRLLGREFVDAYPGRIINVHPSLLPAFPGLHAVRQALEHGVQETGCTVHFVDHGVDTGPIIAQARVPVRADDDVRSLHARIRTEEHKLLCQAVAALAQGALALYGRGVIHGRSGQGRESPT